MTLNIPHEEPHQSKLPGFPYQVDAIEAIRQLEYAAVFHEPGLGKSKIALDLAVTWLKEEQVDSILLVTKRALIANWLNEIHLHSDLFPLILKQDHRANYLAFNSPGRLYLTHYEVVRTEVGRMLLFQKTRRVGIICDEAHKLKNPDSSLFHSFAKLREGFVRRVILTGTPIANRPYDIWALIYFLDGGKALGEDFPAFKGAFDLRSSLSTQHDKRQAFEHHLATLFAKIEPFTVRQTKTSAGIVLPGKVVENVLCEPEELQEELYQVFRQETRAAILKLGAIRFDALDDILKRLLRLIQVASNPRLVTEDYQRAPGKLSYLHNLVHARVDRNEKVIVWTSFVENAIWLQREMRDLHAVCVHGKMTIDDRNKAIAKFMTVEECKVLVATPGAAKEGLTLTAANVAIFFDRTFSLDDYLQAQDRIHRISQEKTCHVYNLLLKDSVDIWVDELLAAKHLAAQLGQGDISAADYHRAATYEFGRALERVLGRLDGDL